MRECLAAPGTVGIGSDIDAAQRQVDSVKTGLHEKVGVSVVAVDGRASPCEVTNTSWQHKSFHSAKSQGDHWGEIRSLLVVT